MAAAEVLVFTENLFGNGHGFLATRPSPTGWDEQLVLFARLQGIAQVWCTSRNAAQVRESLCLTRDGLVKESSACAPFLYLIFRWQGPVVSRLISANVVVNGAEVKNAEERQKKTHPAATCSPSTPPSPHFPRFGEYLTHDF